MEIRDITRVSLFIGQNNGGKTSAMEGAEILIAGKPSALMRSPTRRADGFELEEGSRPNSSIGVRHLFHGHGLSIGSVFELSGEGIDNQNVRCAIAEGQGATEVPSSPSIEDIGAAIAPPLRLTIDVTTSSGGQGWAFQMTNGGRVSIGDLALRFPDESKHVPVNFVGTTDPEYGLQTLWDRVVLTPREAQVVDALRIIEPRIERVAALSRVGNVTGGIVLKTADSEVRVPLGTMGDGIKRLFVLSTNLVSAAGGYLLVDEIDAGLHHSAMVKMWRLVVATAQRLNVQVLASTHSLDCLRALAFACEQVPQQRSEVSVHRIARGAKASTRYGAEEIRIAIEQDMEIR